MLIIYVNKKLPGIPCPVLRIQLCECSTPNLKLEHPAFQMTGLIFISIMENMIVMSKDKIFAGVLTGIAAGAVLALLFTEKGSSIRKKMYSKGKDTAETLKDAFNDFINKIQEKTGMV